MQKRNCPECNKPLTWIPQYQRWYCKKEKIYPVLPLCPLCKQPLNWIPQYKRWYCYNDNTYPSLELSNPPPSPPNAENSLNMANTEKDKIVLGLIDRIDEKRKKIQELTCKIMEYENNLSQENIVKIKQAINEIQYALAYFCPDSELGNLRHFEFQGMELCTDLREFGLDKKTTASQLRPKLREEILSHKLDTYCLEVNSFNPIVINLDKKDSKINLTININGIKIG